MSEDPGNGKEAYGNADDQTVPGRVPDVNKTNEREAREGNPN